MLNFVSTAMPIGQIFIKWNHTVRFCPSFFHGKFAFPSYLKLLFTHPLKLKCCTTSGPLTVLDLLWQALGDLIMTTDVQTFPFLLAISGHLFFLSSLCNPLRLNSPLLANTCHIRRSVGNPVQIFAGMQWRDSDRIMDAQKGLKYLCVCVWKVLCI